MISATAARTIMFLPRPGPITKESNLEIHKHIELAANFKFEYLNSSKGGKVLK